LIDFLAPDSKQRPNDLELGSRDATRTGLAHSAKAGRPGAAKQIHQKSFHEVIGVMAEKNRATPATPCDARKKFVTCRASSCFDRLPRIARERGNVGLAKLELTMEFCGQPLNESRVGFARATAQLMIEMANNKPPVLQVDELVQEGD